MVVGLPSMLWRTLSFRAAPSLMQYPSHRLCAKYGFEKPNDKRALDLMNAAAKTLVTELPEIMIAYGVSDEYR